MSDVTFDLANNKMEVHNNYSEPWRVTLVDTGLHTMTGGRVKRIQPYIGDEPFMLTYGDGVSDLDITALVKFHQSHGKLVTMSAYNAGQRFGVLDIDSSGQIREFREKTQGTAVSSTSASWCASRNSWTTLTETMWFWRRPLWSV